MDGLRRHALSIPANEFLALKGLPSEWTPSLIREEAGRHLDAADKYILAAPADLVGVLAVNKEGVPIELENGKRDGVVLRKATDEPEVMPSPAQFDAVGRNSGRK